MAKHAVDSTWYRDDLGSRVLRPGSQGDDVGNLQAIIAVRFPEIAVGLHASGVYDDRTQQAVKDLQALGELKVDGVAGQKTFDALGI